MHLRARMQLHRSILEDQLDQLKIFTSVVGLFQQFSANVFARKSSSHLSVSCYYEIHSGQNSILLLRNSTQKTQENQDLHFVYPFILVAFMPICGFLLFSRSIVVAAVYFVRNDEREKHKSVIKTPFLPEPIVR